MINESSDGYDQTFPKEVQLKQLGVMWIASKITQRSA